MSTDPKLEAYLTRLDRSLGVIAVSERADIITEIRSHVLAALENDPATNLASVLNSLGEPETVANRYMLERGLKPGKASKSPIVKWLTIGFLGTFGICVVSILLLIWKFSPLISIDDKNERVSILGGMIAVDGKEGRLNIGSTQIHEENGGRVFEGSKPIDLKKIKLAGLKFQNGKINISTAVGNNLSWKCKVEHLSTGDQDFVNESSTQLTLDLSKSAGAKCTIEVPAQLAFALSGTNGKISIERPEFPIDLSLNNGVVSFEDASHRAYKFTIAVASGITDAFDSSQDANAIPIKMSLVNGKISHSQD